MITAISPAELIKEARKHVVSYALFRPESAVIIALTVLVTGFSLLDIVISHQWWWAVLLFGFAAEALIFGSTLKDKHFLGEISRKMFYDRFDTQHLETPELRRNVLKALEFHRDVFNTIRARPEAPLGQIAISMDEWVIQLYNVAHNVDNFVKNPHVVERLNRLSDISGGDLFRASGSNEHDLMIVSAPVFEDNTSNEYDLFAETKKAVIGATHELDGSLNAMYHMHRRITTAHPTELDRVFLEQMRGMMNEHMLRLDQAGDLIQELFSTYAQPQQQGHVIDTARINMMDQ
jgi:hypothetical protein